MRILVATDAWTPQVNGVVQTYERLAEHVRAEGAEISFLTPDHFATVPCPAYPEIRLAIPNPQRARLIIAEFRPDYIHIATEGPVGWMARRYCLSQGRAFTTSYHTRFPEYAAAILSIPSSWAYAPVRRFHARSSGIMVATPSLTSDLSRRGFNRLMPWTRGVDTDLFRPRQLRLFGDGPVFLYAGRLSKEKNIEAFLDSDLPGKKVVVGDGPHHASLQQAYPNVIFTGLKRGEDLAQHYASADVFVFPSKTDTFGLVLLEALASGLPVAAYPVTGPIDVLEHGRSGFLDTDLATAARGALSLDPMAARQRALAFTWSETARLFLDNIRVANAATAQSGPNPAPRPTEGARPNISTRRSISGVPA